MKRTGHLGEEVLFRQIVAGEDLVDHVRIFAFGHDHLGLTIETVSRTLTQFARSGLIRLLPASRSIGLCNKMALRGLNA